jgi:hypothetical protein
MHWNNLKPTFLKTFLHILLLIVTTSCTVFGVRKEESPKYEVLFKEKKYEIRQYQPFILAKVVVKGEFQQSASDSFRILAKYIFGKNKENKKIAMTAPVGESLEDQSNISKEAEMKLKDMDLQSWKVTFAMPSKYSKEELPTPVDPRIKLVKESKSKYAVLSFSGGTSNEKLIQKLLKLKKWMEKNNLEATSTFWVWRYDPPWTIPVFRKNEIAIKVKD